MILRARTATIKIKEISEIVQVIDAIIVKHGQMYAWLRCTQFLQCQNAIQGTSNYIPK